MLQRHLDYADLARFFSAAGNYAAALDMCASGLRLRGADAMLLVRRAQAHDALENYTQAISDCKYALQLDPPAKVAVLAATTLALALESTNNVPAALEAARAAIAFEPADQVAHCVLGNLLAWHGELATAWPELECHWLSERIAFRRRFGRPEWNGEPLSGGRMLVVHGQGFGDMIQMVRYLPRLRERVDHVTLECPATFEPLLRGFHGIDAIVERGTSTTDDFDVFVRLMSLPRLLGESASNEEPAPYLRVPREHAAHWQRPVSTESALRVGLTWAGNPFHAQDRWRSLRLEDCSPLAAVSGVRWTSLQVGPRANDADGGPITLERHERAIASFADTAAIIMQLDLVITVDTAVAHLAGALGVPVWLLLRKRPDWRWPRTGQTTPWYPSMLLVRAQEPSWSGVIESVASRLRERTLHAGQ